uniref:Uncharacterized protein n=1 Tax=Caenorhabditis japonica TaxID=281687 RepID=A0A8R1EEW6_CAEJA
MIFRGRRMGKGKRKRKQRGDDDDDDGGDDDDDEEDDEETRVESVAESKKATMAANRATRKGVASGQEAWRAVLSGKKGPFS